MRLLLALILCITLNSGALAMGGGGGGGGGGSSNSSDDSSGNRFLLVFNLGGDDADAEEDDHAAEEEADDDPRTFNLPALVVPLSQDGRLTGFAYVQLRVRANDGENVWSMQENVHYALDALVRSGYRTPVSAEDGQSLDQARAEEVWADVLREQYGANAIDHVEIRTTATRILSR